MNKVITNVFVKVEKTYGKIHTNWQAVFPTKRNTFAESYNKYKDRKYFKHEHCLDF